MNKISKKIVSLVTMAAFVLTLVPAAAFAAPAVDSSYVTVDEDTQEITLDNGSATANVEVSVGTADENKGNVVVWLTTNNGNEDVLYPYATVNTTTGVRAGSGNFEGTAAIDGAKAGDYTVSFTLKQAGTYTVHAGIDLGSNAANVGAVIDDQRLLTVDGVNTITVGAAAVDYLEIYKMGEATYTPWESDGTYDLDLRNTSFDADGIQVYNMDIYAKDGGQAGVTVPGAVITIEEDSDKLQLLNKDEDPETEGVQVTTDKAGKITLSFKMTDKRNVPITLSCGEAEYTLKVIMEGRTPYDINVTKDGGYVLAGGDKWAYDGQEIFTNAVQFSVVDINKDAFTGEIKGEPAFEYTGAKISIESAPKKSDLKADELALVWDENAGVYTLKYKNAYNSTEIAKDLIPGEYVVRVGLKSGDYAEATFTVAKFGKVADTEITMTANDRSTWDNGNASGEVRKVDISDEVTLDQNVYAKAYYVDENGLMVPAKDVVIGAYGKALIDNKTATGELKFQTKDDESYNETLIGTTVTVTAASDKYEQYKTWELTVVDSYNAFGLEFDPAEGPINEDNQVAVKVVKEDGTTAQVSGKIIAAFVDDQSNKDAKVTVEAVNNGTVTKGKGAITVYASKPTTVDIVVVVEDATNNGLYGATLEYNAGNVDITAHHEVTMTIGSSKYVVDKQLFEMDAAPYVDSNWRTMVPIRALAEAFDAEVVYDNDDRTVTIDYDGKIIVMTIDESTYTVDGEELAMDTAAVIKGDRTYVPVRFAAEAMGFTVNALYNEGNSTASVVFQS